MYCELVDQSICVTTSWICVMYPTRINFSSSSSNISIQQFSDDAATKRPLGLNLIRKIPMDDRYRMIETSNVFTECKGLLHFVLVF